MESVAQGELNRRYGTTGDICTRFRPRRASEMIGAVTVKPLLIKAMSMGATRPKAYLLHGPSGCVVGKTTIRIRKIANGKTPVVQPPQPE